MGPNGRPQRAPSLGVSPSACGVGAPAGKPSTVSCGDVVLARPEPQRTVVARAAVDGAVHHDRHRLVHHDADAHVDRHVGRPPRTPAALGAETSGTSSRRQWASRKIAGTEIAMTLTQYWNAWTNVMPLIPPSATLVVITPPTTTTPTQYGVPISTDRVTPAPFICGSR